MGQHGFYVIDADGHGGEPLDWRSRIPDAFRPQMEGWVAKIKGRYRDLPGGGMRVEGGEQPGGTRDPLQVEADGMRIGMSRPAERLEDMDFEGIDVTVMFSGGNGEEWALLDRDFSIALCRTLNDARAEYAMHAPDRLKHMAKLPMYWPEAAAEELERVVTQHPGTFVGMSTTQHLRERNLDDPVFDVVWETAQRLDVAVCTHGGGQAPDQFPFGIDRLSTRLTIHAMTHPLGAMLDVISFTVGGILRRFPGLRVGFMEASSGWVPFWLERLDEHWELMPQQAPEIDQPPSTYYHGRCFTSAEPEEKTVPFVLQALPDPTICYASDYCHWDCAFPNSVKLWAERDDLDHAQKRLILTENPARLYRIPIPADAP
jgi:uncharacterized protein